MCVYDVCVCECACICMHVCMCVCAYEPMYTRPKSVQLHFASFLFTQKKLLTCTSHDKQAKNLEDFFSKKESLLSPKPSYILDVRKKRSHSLTYSRQFQHKPNAVKREQLSKDLPIGPMTPPPHSPHFFCGTGPSAWNGWLPKEEVNCQKTSRTCPHIAWGAPVYVRYYLEILRTLAQYLCIWWLQLVWLSCMEWLQLVERDSNKNNVSFCKRAVLFEGTFPNESCKFVWPTTRSHPHTSMNVAIIVFCRNNVTTHQYIYTNTDNLCWTYIHPHAMLKRKTFWSGAKYLPPDEALLWRWWTWVSTFCLSGWRLPCCPSGRNSWARKTLFLQPCHGCQNRCTRTYTQHRQTCAIFTYIYTYTYTYYIYTYMYIYTYYIYIYVYIYTYIYIYIIYLYKWIYKCVYKPKHVPTYIMYT